MKGEVWWWGSCGEKNLALGITVGGMGVGRGGGEAEQDLALGITVERGGMGVGWGRVESSTRDNS